MMVSTSFADQTLSTVMNENPKGMVVNLPECSFWLGVIQSATRLVTTNEMRHSQLKELLHGYRLVSEDIPGLVRGAHFESKRDIDMFLDLD